MFYCVCSGRLREQLKDIVIIESEDAILVADKNSSGEVKKIIEKLKEGGQNYL